MNCPLCGRDTNDESVVGLLVHQECWNDVPEDAVLDWARLRRIEAAARAFLDRPGSETAERAALRVALQSQEAGE